jgi:hypothetical protein
MDLVIPYISEGRRPLLWISSYIRPVWDFCPSQCSCTSSHGRVVCLPSYTTFTLVSKKRCLIRSRKSKKNTDNNLQNTTQKTKD